MKLSELLHIPANNHKALIAVPMTLGPTDKFGPYQQLLVQQNPDLVEWRADYIVDEFSQAVIWQQVKEGARQELSQKEISAMTEAKMLDELDQARQEFLSNWPAMQTAIIKEMVSDVFDTVGQIPLILTYRTKGQGGRGEFDEVEYANFLVTALQTGLPFAAVDIEETLEDGLKEKVMAAAHQRQIPIILSYHDWQQTPTNLVDILTDLSQEKADIIKLATMPAKEDDVDRLLAATQAVNQVTDKPLITMAMGSLGERSRIIGYQYGSQMTFAALADRYTSAPGQLTIDGLLQAWRSL